MLFFLTQRVVCDQFPYRIYFNGKQKLTQKTRDLQGASAHFDCSLDFTKTFRDSLYVSSFLRPHLFPYNDLTIFSANKRGAKLSVCQTDPCGFFFYFFLCASSQFVKIYTMTGAEHPEHRYMLEY